MTSGSKGIKLVNIVLSSACDSPTDAVNDCLNADRVHIGFVATSFFLVAAAGVGLQSVIMGGFSQM